MQTNFDLKVPDLRTGIHPARPTRRPRNDPQRPPAVPVRHLWPVLPAEVEPARARAASSRRATLQL